MLSRTYIMRLREQLERKDRAILQLQAGTGLGRDLIHRASPGFSLAP